MYDEITPIKTSSLYFANKIYISGENLNEAGGNDFILALRYRKFLFFIAQFELNSDKVIIYYYILLSLIIIACVRIEFQN